MNNLTNKIKTYIDEIDKQMKKSKFKFIGNFVRLGSSKTGQLSVEKKAYFFIEFLGSKTWKKVLEPRITKNWS